MTNETDQLTTDVSISISRAASTAGRLLTTQTFAAADSEPAGRWFCLFKSHLKPKQKHWNSFLPERSVGVVAKRKWDGLRGSLSFSTPPNEVVINTENSCWNLHHSSAISCGFPLNRSPAAETRITFHLPPLCPLQPDHSVYAVNFLNGKKPLCPQNLEPVYWKRHYW